MKREHRITKQSFDPSPFHLDADANVHRRAAAMLISSLANVSWSLNFFFKDRISFFFGRLVAPVDMILIPDPLLMNFE